MFDIGFWELLLLAMVGLLVMGPERMPRAMVQAGRALAHLRRTLFSLRREFERQARLEEGETLEERMGRLDDLVEEAPDKKPPTRP